jgi:hypothetical protein
MKTAHAIFGAVVAAFGVAAFVTFYDEFKPGTQTPPDPNAAAQKTDSLTPANSIAHDFAVLHTTLASSIAPELADVPKPVGTVPPGTKTPRRPNAAAQKADPLTPANSIAHDFAVLSTPANSIAPELADVPKSVQTVPIGRGSTLQLALPAPTQAVAPTPAPPAARVADHQAVPETLPSHAEPVDVCARNGGHRVDFMRGHHAMWKCVYQTRRQ